MSVQPSHSVSRSHSLPLITFLAAFLAFPALGCRTHQKAQRLCSVPTVGHIPYLSPPRTHTTPVSGRILLRHGCHQTDPFSPFSGHRQGLFAEHASGQNCPHAFHTPSICPHQLPSRAWTHPLAVPLPPLRSGPPTRPGHKSTPMFLHPSLCLSSLHPPTMGVVLMLLYGLPTAPN